MRSQTLFALLLVGLMKSNDACLQAVQNAADVVGDTAQSVVDAGSSAFEAIQDNVAAVGNTAQSVADKVSSASQSAEDAVTNVVQRAASVVNNTVNAADVVSAVNEVVDTVSNAASLAANVTRQWGNGTTATDWKVYARRAGIGLGIGALVGPVAVWLTLAIIGFTASGVVEGSLAAFCQGRFFGAFTSGWFSILQSCGTCPIPYVISTIVVGGVAGAVIGVVTTPASELHDPSKALERFNHTTTQPLEDLVPNKNITDWTAYARRAGIGFGIGFVVPVAFQLCLGIPQFCRRASYQTVSSNQHQSAGTCRWKCLLVLMIVGGIAGAVIGAVTTPVPGPMTTLVTGPMPTPYP